MIYSVGWYLVIAVLWMLFEDMSSFTSGSGFVHTGGVNVTGGCTGFGVVVGVGGGGVLVSVAGVWE